MKKFLVSLVMLVVTTLGAHAQCECLTDRT